MLPLRMTAAELIRLVRNNLVVVNVVSTNGSLSRARAKYTPLRPSASCAAYVPNGSLIP